jgi:hypothetical protein
MDAKTGKQALGTSAYKTLKNEYTNTQAEGRAHTHSKLKTCLKTDKPKEKLIFLPEEDFWILFAANGRQTKPKWPWVCVETFMVACAIGTKNGCC